MNSIVKSSIGDELSGIRTAFVKYITDNNISELSGELKKYYQDAMEKATKEKKKTAVQPDAKQADSDISKIIDTTS